MCLVTVLGVGSPHGADQLGWKLVECLQQHSTLKPYLGNRLECVILDRPGPRLLEYLEQAPVVVIIDAAVDGGETGRLSQYSAREIVENDIQFSSHQFGVQQSLALGLSLGDVPDGVRVFAISVTETDQLMSESECEQWANRLCSEVAEQVSLLVVNST